jgi:ABC-type hemin transport system ATPase subunit
MPSQAVVSLWGGTGSVAVVGPNGAGKSMLLKVRAGNRGYNTPQLLQSLRICPVPGRQQTPSI